MHILAMKFACKEVNVFGKSDYEEDASCISSGFLLGVEDGFLLLSAKIDGEVDMAIALNQIEAVARIREPEDAKVLTLHRGRNEDN